MRFILRSQVSANLTTNYVTNTDDEQNKSKITFPLFDIMMMGFFEDEYRGKKGRRLSVFRI